MKYHRALLTGNVLIGLGVLVIVFSVMDLLVAALLPYTFSVWSMWGVFIGAGIWMVGVRLGDRESITERYWWVRHFDKRDRHSSHKKE
ncbi:stress-induced protein YchH [Salmonella enterica subsp. diarizonae]|nr:stress-induced protein YchH [Salmonella enterica subsp. diarizonae]ELJ4793915.1 DUF2583 family protein [Salmonella enterica]